MAKIIDEKLAKDTICSCYLFKIDDEIEDLCWTKGAIGILSQEQEKKFCLGKMYLNPTQANWLLKQILEAYKNCENKDNKSKCIKEYLSKI